MRWLYHLVPRRDAGGDGPYAPHSLAAEGFVHASFRDEVLESARLHFAPGEDLVALRIDPRRLPARLEIAATPRGPMPHVHGPVPRDAIREAVELSAIGAAPERVTGTRIAFVAFAGMTLLDLVGALDPLSRIASMGFDPTTTCTLVRATDAPAWADAGAALEVAEERPPLDGYDVVVVPGGFGTRALERDAEVIAWLAAYPENRLVASVCTGSLLLGAAGRLRGRRATTHHRQLGRLAEYGATAMRERVVDEGQVVTAGGVTSAIDLGLNLVRRLEGDEVAGAIAAQMEWVGARAG
jgi:cyclohexyl-isocyanide hydratase